MKKLLTYIIFLIFVFKSFAAYSAEPQLPDDFKGLNMRERLAELADDERAELPLLQRILIMYEIGNYFNNKYPNDEVYDEDFDENLKPFFPNADEYQLRKYTNLLRTGITVYRLGRFVYNKYVTQKLVPAAYRQVHSESDFDHPDEVKYQEAPTGEFIKVYNFKKFLTYSHNPEERKAIEDYKKLQTSKDDVYAQFEYALTHIEWKKLLLYGEKYKNPLLSDFGVGEFEEGLDVRVRLLSDATTINGQKEFYAGLQVNTENNKFVLANNLASDMQKPRIDLQKSKNLESYQVLYPAPQNSVSFPFAYKYFGNFLIPIKVTVKNPEEPLLLNAKVNMTVCDGALACLEQSFEPKLIVLTGKDFSFTNGYQNFFQQNINMLPNNESEKLKLEKFVVDKDADGESLRLEFELNGDMESFNIFIEDTDGYNLFSVPFISIQDNKIFVRFEPLNKHAKLENTEYIITTVLNGYDAYRTTRLVAQAALFDTETASLSLGLLLLAVLGGFILNFMPCVFPVLSLKIISLSRAQSMQQKRLKKSLFITVCGIFSGFTILIVLLLAAKFAGYSLGWGMQYQNMTFLVIMSFALAGFMMILPRLQSSRLQNISVSQEKKLGFLIGNLIVLLSTPCTGPYLATAVGFALGGSYSDIIQIMYAVALGLSIPYLLALTINNPETLLPKPGSWLNVLQSCMRLMLFLTICWFAVLIYNQTDFNCVLILAVFLLIFCGVFVLYRRFTDYLDGVFDESVTLEVIERLRKISRIAICGLFAVLVTIMSFYAENSHQHNLLENAVTRQTFLDKKMIAEKLGAGRSVLLEIGADWCLTCHYNGVMTLTDKNLKIWNEIYNMDFVKVDWTNYNKEVLDFMAKYGRKGLPFYILYTPLMRDGLVLPEIFTSRELENILQTSALR